MKRIIGTLLGLITTVVALGIVAAWAFVHFDWNRAKPWLASSVSHAIGRNVAIDGDLLVRWQRDPQVHGWRAWVPGANISAAKVTIGNTQWGKQPVFATADRVEFDLSLLPLLFRTLSVPAVRFVAPDVHFERLADGRANWTFEADPASITPPWNLDLGSVKFYDGELSVADRLKALDVRVHLQALDKSIPFDELVAQQEEVSRREAAARIGGGAADKFSTHARKRDESLRRGHENVQEYAFSFTVEGSFRGNSVKGDGGVASVLALKTPDQPFPLHADVRIGDTRVALIGTLTDPTDLAALDLRLWLSGKSLAQLYDVLRLTMPESPPYATEGHLVGAFKKQAKSLRYEDFTARVGASDLIGELSYETKQPRPLLTGTVQSQHLQFRDLAPMIGAQPAAEDSTGKVLPAKPFRPERWQAMDADVKFTGDHVFRDSELPIHKVDTRIVMDNAVLSLKPLRFQFADGDVDSTLRFDGRTAPVKGSFDLTARDVRLKQIFKAAETTNLDLGTAHGSASLTANGDSVGSLLGAANGELRAALDGGTISKAFIETAGLNIPNIVLAKLFGDNPVKIGCAAADLVAEDGVFDARAFVVDTDIARFDVTGNVNLANEKLDLVVRTSTKSVRLLSLHAPIHLNGPMREPDISIDKGVVLARSAGAIGLAIIATPLAVVPLTNTGFGKGDNACAPIVNEIEQSTPASKAGAASSRN
jgi:uncharacterized protein involved in outer membrane biogenesis